MNDNICDSIRLYPYMAVKRVFDVLLSVILVFFSIVPMLAVALIVRFSSRGPAVFRQKRVGQNGKLFYCFKFRTMYVDAPNSAATSEMENCEKYITPFGSFLRKTSIDELPQLINVIKGDMSLVGPRPLIPKERYIHDERKRLGVYRVRPGITGLAQINGRDLVPPDEKVRYDCEYVCNFGPVQDLKILVGTFSNVLKKKGIHEGKI